MQKQYDWLFFDLDNTLLDFSMSEAQALKIAIIERGIPFEDAFVEAYRVINKECWTAYENGTLAKAELKTKRFQWFFDKIGHSTEIPEFANDYLKYLSQTAYFIEGAEQLLEYVSTKYKLVLVSNGLANVQHPRLEQSGLKHIFKHIIISDEIGTAKPHTGFFDYAFDKIGKPKPEATLMIGDNPNADIQGALDYGMDACWYNPNQYDNPHNPNPTYSIQHLSELKDML